MKRIFINILLLIITAASTAGCLNETNVKAANSAAKEYSRLQTEKAKADDMICINISVEDKAFEAVLYDNETAKAFAEKLPVTYDMSELNGNEKYFFMEDSLPADSISPDTINAGDIMLYNSDCLVIFYDSFSSSYSYTPMGYIENPEGLAEALGNGNAMVSFTRLS